MTDVEVEEVPMTDVELEDEDGEDELPLSKGKEKVFYPRITRSSAAKMRKIEDSGSGGDASDADQLMAEAVSTASGEDALEEEPTKREPKKGNGEPSKNARDVEGAKGKRKGKGRDHSTSGRGETAASKTGSGKVGSKAKIPGMIQTLVGQVSA